MPASLYESDIEEFAVTLLQRQGYAHLPPHKQEDEREDSSAVVLTERLRQAIDTLNPDVPAAAREDALRQTLNLPQRSLTESNALFHRMMTEGVRVEYQQNGNTVGNIVRLFNFAEPAANNCAVCNQFTVSDNNINRRPDLALFINGLPLAVIELKNPADENATVEKAFTQLQNYKNAIPRLFIYNGVLAASDGLEAKAGSLTADMSRFAAWKTVDGVKEDPANVPQLETLIKGMLRPDVLLDLIKQFTVFEDTQITDKKTGIISAAKAKKIATYHQYHAVNAAVASTLRACGESVAEAPAAYGLPSVSGQPLRDRKAGVVWHTQGSGKSLSMLFYAGKVVPALGNPTIVIITDRNDLDSQLFATFAAGSRLLRQTPAQARSRAQLKKLLATASGGVVFTTIQKFSPDDGGEVFDTLSARDNIVVIADEAHRSQYGFAAKTRADKNTAHVRYGFAKYLRDALPNASFIGFTATPIEKEDASTPAIFGNYIDVYDILQAVEDGATVKIYYESRLVNVHLKEEDKALLDEEAEMVSEEAESFAAEKAKLKWTQLEAIVGHKERLKTVARDILQHFAARQEVMEGKSMVVTMSRRIAVALYEQITAINPHWHHPDKQKGGIKIVMTSSSSDPESWQVHHTGKEERQEISRRFKDPEDPLQMVIVCDMWLTGFDVPCLHTMYIDKPMRGHNLMQAIARVNRVYKDKSGGLIVDYLGIASDLKKAIAVYTGKRGAGASAFNISAAIKLMQEKHEIVAQMFHGYDYRRFFSADVRAKLTVILEAQEHILSLENGKNRFMREVTALSKAFALSVPNEEAIKIRDEVGFFQAVKARLTKYAPAGGGKDADVETAIRQIVDRALTAKEVIDVFDAAGIAKPNIGILSDQFLEEIKNMRYKNIALELLKKLLRDEIALRTRKNFIQSRKLSELLAAAISKYQNNLLTAAQVIEELITIAKEIKEADKRGEEMGLSDDEVAFYDALADNDSAREVLGDETLREIAQVLVEKVRKNTTIDWTLKESVKAKIRVVVKRILRKYGYPPDKALRATENILDQAVLLSEEWLERF